MLATLYDVHGNLLALEAVLADAREQGATRWLLGGDYASFGGWPDETIARLDALDGATWIRGNADRWLADDADVPSGPVPAALDACRTALGAETVARLVALPERHDDGDTLFCHASPASDMQSFAPVAGPDDEPLLERAGGARRVVFGHTHVPFVRRRPDGVELLNPGSVGIPLDGDPRASYALVHPDGRIEHRRVEYAHEAAAERVVERFGGAPWTEVFAQRISTARLG